MATQPTVGRMLSEAESTAPMRWTQLGGRRGQVGATAVRTTG